VRFLTDAAISEFGKETEAVTFACMVEMEEVIEEELTALEAIFYDSYSKISENSFRVRIDPDVEEEEGTDVPPPLFLEFLLPEGYPQIIPKFDLSNLNNSNYPDVVKASILEGLQAQVCKSVHLMLVGACHLVVDACPRYVVRLVYCEILDSALQVLSMIIKKELRVTLNSLLAVG
jgi:hypothetical protein